MFIHHHLLTVGLLGIAAILGTAFTLFRLLLMSLGDGS